MNQEDRLMRMEEKIDRLLIGLSKLELQQPMLKQNIELLDARLSPIEKDVGFVKWALRGLLGLIIVLYYISRIIR